MIIFKYKKLILKNNNLDINFNNYFNDNNIFKLNLLKNHLIDNNLFKYIYIIDKNNCFLLDDRYLFNNYFLNSNIILNNLKFINNEELNNFLLDNNHLNTKLDFLNNLNINNKILLLDNQLLINNQNLNNNSINDYLNEILFDNNFKTILLSIKKIFFNKLYMSLNNYNKILLHINKEIDNKLLITSYNKIYYNINKNTFNIRNNNNLELNNNLIIHIKTFNDTELINFNKIKNYLFYLYSDYIVCFVNLLEVNINNNSYVNLKFKLFQNDKKILNNSLLYINSLFNLDNKIELNSSEINNLNLIDEQYSISLDKANLLNLNNNSINNYLFLYENETILIPKLIFKITNIIFFENNILVYCNIYNNNYLKYKNIYLSSIVNYNINKYEYKIYNINENLYDGQIIFNHIKNYNSNYLNTISDSEYKIIALKSIKYGIKYNFKFLENIYNSVFKNINVIYSIINYKKLENDLINTDNFIFDNFYKNISIIDYFFNNFKLSYLNINNNELKNSENNFILYIIDYLNDKINDYYYQIYINYNKNLQYLIEEDKFIFKKIIKQINYVSTNNIQIEIISENININPNDTLYIFKNKDENFLTKLKLINKKLKDLDENLYIYTCDLLDNKLDGLYPNYLISSNNSTINTKKL